MPTTKPRHAVTETGAVAQALAELRAEPGGEDVPISELVVIGARTLAAETRADSDWPCCAMYAKALIAASAWPAARSDNARLVSAVARFSAPAGRPAPCRFPPRDMV